MSKAIYAYRRNGIFDSNNKKKLKKICERLKPDNVESEVEHRISVDEKVCYGVMNYQPVISIDGRNLLLGYLYEQRENWNEPLTQFPDGSYALFREDKNHLEVVADVAGSRTIWYYFDDKLFITSTSQRAIIMFLGDFIFDDRVIPWILSTGSLGPEYSWDKRLERIPPDSSVVLDKRDWSISSRENPIEFSVKERSREEHKKLLKGAIEETIDSLKNLNINKWALPLSGGCDSRALLCFMDQNDSIPEEIQTITWGLEESLEDKDNDAFIAKKVAKTIGVPHRYYPISFSEEPVEKNFDRFLKCVEGRIDHFTGYEDGLNMWADLFDKNIQGIIRGDSPFWGGLGELSGSDKKIVRRKMGCPLCSDYSKLGDLVKNSNLPEQHFPSNLELNADESLISWGDRLYQNYRTPIILAALSDLKYSFLEQINPLHSKLVIKRMRELPKDLRSDKSFFAEIVDSISPEIPYAKRGATYPFGDILRKNEVVELFIKKIRTERSKEIFSSELIDFVLDGIQRKNNPPNSDYSTQSLGQKLKELTPKNWRDFIFKDVLSQSEVFLNFYYLIVHSHTVDKNKLAFRVFIIIRMIEIFEEDVKVIEK